MHRFLTGEGFREAVKNAEAVSASLPPFRFDCRILLNEPLKGMGMRDAFDGQAADFPRLGHSTPGNPVMAEALH
ncbi:MAG TPA: hypothetical protein H9684_10280 [Firmicutes bacterium]|nr:hypothetical protein [Bacillota bacterium]